MLPFPCSPSSTWAIYRARLKAVFDGANPWICVSFWLFGLINNVLYVIILTAAQDLVGQSVPKGVVLLADVVPSFITKLLAPYFIHRIPYNVRIMVFAAFSSIGMLLVACSSTATESSAIGTKMFGIVLASISSGGGELSFLGLTHYYGHFALAFWASGTGGAGLIGAWAYVIATTWAGLSVRSSLLAFSFLPVIMLASFFWLLPKGPLTYVRTYGYESLENNESAGTLNPEVDRCGTDSHEHGNEDLLSPSAYPPTSRSGESLPIWSGFKANLLRSRALFLPYMLPLLFVYVAEYTINQGVSPTLLFPLDSSPFEDYLSFYRAYNAIYQAGVFISRSSTPFFRIHHLYPPSILQVANLVLLTLHAVFDFIPTVWIVFLIIFWEGLLGGLVYVSTFAEITDNVPKSDREFSLGATSVSDSGGICIAGFLSMVFEIWLCNYQASHGRDYCKRVSVNEAG